MSLSMFLAPMLLGVMAGPFGGGVVGQLTVGTTLAAVATLASVFIFALAKPPEAAAFGGPPGGSPLEGQPGEGSPPPEAGEPPPGAGGLPPR